jgi:signal transduction histidine kinase
MSADPLLTAVVEALPLGVLLQDDERRIEVVNTAFLDLAGISARPAELVGIDFDASAEHVEALLDQPDADRVVRRECVPLQVDGHPRGRLWFLLDQTEQAAARRSAAEQDRALAELAALRSDFVATVSHQLRTPLTSIVGLSTLLLEGGSAALSGETGGSYSEEHEACLQAINRSAERLLRLADDLTLLSGLESGGLPLHDDPVDLAALARGRLTDWLEAADRTDIALRADVPAGPGDPVHGDESVLTRLLDDLVETALRVLPTPAALAITLCPAPGGWLVELTDETFRLAPGEDPLPAAFAPYGAAGEAVRQAAGLGPMIIRAAAARHHGTVEVVHGDAATAGVTASTIRVHLPCRGARAR